MTQLESEKFLTGLIVSMDPDISNELFSLGRLNGSNPREEIEAHDDPFEPRPIHPDIDLVSGLNVTNHSSSVPCCNPPKNMGTCLSTIPCATNKIADGCARMSKPVPFEPSDDATHILLCNCMDRNMDRQRGKESDLWLHHTSYGRFQEIMNRSEESQDQLQQWDISQGLPKSHSPAMVKTSRSRRQLQTGRILPKWDGSPLINDETELGKPRKRRTRKSSHSSSAGKIRKPCFESLNVQTDRDGFGKSWLE
jgi:hypothetical protein